ncbi:hypothetical protein DFJ77DRAFT_431584 [Powellomyces hirtus]|nr:hypothetical protein DFJ77DRAFT_431584 [Powellomyces hirtus]
MSLLVACALRRPIPYTRAVRNLWTTATSSSSSLDKALNACTAALHKSKQSPRKQSQLCVVLASAHYPAASLEHLGRAVSDQFAPKCLIGAVVDSVAGTEGSSLGPGLSITLMDNDAKAECVGFMVNSDNVRHVKQKAVGRWPDMGRGFGIKGRDTDAEAFDLERFTTVSMGGGNVELPEKLQRILPSSEETALLLTFSDKEPYQFLETLDHSFPKATKIGLMGTMTPFVNGRPHTLYYNDKVLSGGLVGAAFVSKTLKASEKVSFAGLEALGEPLTITSCRGNIILNIDDTNAAKELLARMNNREMTAGIAAERQLYVRVSRGEKLAQTSAVYRLTGGDPSKGTLAVDTIKDLEIGMQIQVCNSHISFCLYVG